MASARPVASARTVEVSAGSKALRENANSPASDATGGVASSRETGIRSCWKSTGATRSLTMSDAVSPALRTVSVIVR